MNDAHFMQEALALAARGRGRTSPNPMVGAVVVRNGAVVGTGYHRFAGGAHAEAAALAEAGEGARGATLYVTLEPCNHTGRTPPCTRSILEAGVQRVVIAMADPNPAVAGGGAEVLRRAGLEVETGLCEAEALALNEVFVKYVLTRRPFVTVKCAATLDGRIATRTGDSRWVTGAAARAWVHELRDVTDAIMVGAGTVAADDPQLTARPANRPGKDPVRIVLDTRARTPPAARVVRHESEAETLIVVGRGLPPKARLPLERRGVRLVEAETAGGRIDLDPLMDQLGAMNITSLLLEGGSRVLAAAFRAGVVDKACFFYAPLVAAGDDGVPICSGAGPERMRDCIRLGRIRVQRFEDDVMIEGYVGR